MSASTTPPSTVYTPPPTGPGFTYTDTPPGNTDVIEPHGTITRAEIILRAQQWLSENVPYSETSWWTDSDGTYRQDCSGYVSMAWGLDQDIDFWTGNLNTVSHTIPAVDLAPGDILLSDSHTVLFAGWADTAHTEFDYYEEAHPGTDARFVVDAPIAEYLNAGFVPFRYDGVLDTPAADIPANPVDGLAFTALQAGGSELAPNGNNTSMPAPASFQAGYVTPSSTPTPPKAAASGTQAAAFAAPIPPPLSFMLGTAGAVFMVGGAVIARGGRRLAGAARRPRRRH